MTKINFLLILFCVFFDGAAQQIDVLTYNIRYASFDTLPQNWNLRKEGVLSILKDHDFIGLQEVMPVQMADINQNMSDDFGSLFRTRDADSTTGEGCPILFYKKNWELLHGGFFWLSDTPEIQGSNTWGAAFNRMVTYGFFRSIISWDSILVINTHFDHISQTARENSVDLLLEKFKKYISVYPVILMGDLNITPENNVYFKLLSGTSLSDSYLVANPSVTNTGATFHGWRPQIPGDRIDYIFISPMIHVGSSKVLQTMFNGRYPSDHFPLNSIVSLKK